MRATTKLIHWNVGAASAGFGLFAIGLLSITARGQEAPRKPADTHDEATKVTDQAVAEASFLSCLVKGLGGAGSCIEVFSDGSDPDGFWICFETASTQYVRCTGSVGAASSDVSTGGVDELGLGLMARAAERAFAQMQKEDSSMGSDRAAAIVARVLADRRPVPGGVDAQAQETRHKPAASGDEATKVTAQAAVEALFISCLSKGSADVRSCGGVYSRGSDPDGFWNCVGSASTQFSRCMGSESATGSDDSARGVEKLGLELLAQVAERTFVHMQRRNSGPSDLEELDSERSRALSLGESETEEATSWHSASDGALEELPRPGGNVDPDGDAVDADPEDVDAPGLLFASWGPWRPDPRDGGNRTRISTRGYSPSSFPYWGTCGIVTCDCPIIGAPPSVLASVNLTSVHTVYFPLVNGIYLKLAKCCTLDQTSGTPDDPTDDTTCKIPDSGETPLSNNCVSTIKHECAHACAAAYYGHVLYQILIDLESIRCGFDWYCNYYEQEAEFIESQSGPSSWRIQRFSRCADGSP